MAKAWKELELRIAEKLRPIFPLAKRNPLSGIVDDSTHADIKNIPIYIEAKHSSRVPFMRVYLGAREQARREGKEITMVAFHSKGSPFVIAMMDLEELVKLVMDRARS